MYRFNFSNAMKLGLKWFLSTLFAWCCLLGPQAVYAQNNTAPIADAGPDQSVDEFTLVLLDGRDSSDPENDTLTYIWTQTSGPAVALQNATQVIPRFTTPILMNNTPVTLTFSLVVNDGMVDSPADTVTVTVSNVDLPNSVEVNGFSAFGPQACVVQSSFTLTGATTDFSFPTNDVDRFQIEIVDINRNPLPTGVFTFFHNPNEQPRVGQTLIGSTNLTASATVRPHAVVVFDVENFGDIVGAPIIAQAPIDLAAMTAVGGGCAFLASQAAPAISPNTAPTANAGPDQSVNGGETVTLDGTGSTDPDSDPLTYVWTQTAGLQATILDANTASPSFTAPTLNNNTPVDFIFSLVVSDGTLSSVADTVTITVTNNNTAPIANAGPDQSVDEGDTVTLDGTGSTDPENNALTYVWTQTAGLQATILDANTASPSFTAPTLNNNTPVDFIFSLVVSDGTLSSVADTVTITVNNNNTAPVAEAGPDQMGLAAGAIVTLDGTDSTDADGDVLIYAWTQTSGPPVVLDDVTAASPTFTAPSVATDMVVTFSLVVNDSQLDSLADDVSLSILENTPPTIEITGVPGTTNAPFTATFTFSENVTGFALADLVLINASASDFAGSGTSYTALITPSGDGVSTIDIPAGAAQDAAGNGNVAAAQARTTFDLTAPSVVLSGVPDSVRGPFDLTISFNEAVTGLSAEDLTIDNGTASNLIAISNQVYTVTITPIAHGLVTMSLDEGAVQDAAGNDSEASNTLITDFIDESFVRTRTSGIINNFIARRADQITLNDPDLSRRLLDHGTNGRLSGQADHRSANISFSGKASGEEAQLGKFIGTDQASKVNLWVEASLVSINADTSDSDLVLIHAGIDYRVNEDTLIGLAGQYDYADEQDDVQVFDVSGNGWLIGPYVVSRVTDNLILDGRIGFGQSSNEVSPFRTYTDEFDTNRLLLKGQATGDFHIDDWNINPSLAVIYYEETQEAFTDSLNIDIPEQTVTLGRVSFGPRFSKTFVTAKDVIITPSFGVRGVWDFEQAQIVDINSGFAASTDQLRARTEAGISGEFDNGVNISTQGFYDGIGASNFQAYGVTLGVRKNF